MRSLSMQSLTNDTRAMFPGVVIYGIGDAAHQSSPSDHNEDDTYGSNSAQSDADSNPEHRAIDVMLGPAFSAAQAEAYTQKLVTRPTNQARLYNVIYNRRIWRRNGGWREEPYYGSNPHTDHPHVSGWAGDDENGAPWDLGDQPTSSDERIKSMSTVYHKEGTNPALYALAGESPGTSANWLETTDYPFAVDLVKIHHPQAFQRARTLSADTWDEWKRRYLEPVATDAIEIDNAPAGGQPDNSG